MYHPQMFDAMGEPWRATITVAASTTEIAASPKPLYTGPANIGGQTNLSRYGLVLLGYSVHVTTTGASSLGIVARDPWFNPLGEGTNDDPIFTHTFSGATTNFVRTVNCFIALSKANYRAEASPTTGNGASIYVVPGATISGSITLWGLHTQLDFGRYSNTSSPAEFS